jgi:hypothetical protein
METVRYQYNKFEFNINGVSINLNMEGFKIVGDTDFYKGRVDFETTLKRYDPNTCASMIAQHDGSYFIMVVASTRVSNPIEFSFTLVTTQGKTQFLEAYNLYIKDYTTTDISTITF